MKTKPVSHNSFPAYEATMKSLLHTGNCVEKLLRTPEWNRLSANQIAELAYRWRVVYSYPLEFPKNPVKLKDE